MTLDQFQSTLHALYQGDTNTPTSSEDDYTYRTSLLGSAIDDWNDEKGIQWAELAKWNTDGQTQTTDGVTVKFACYSDFAYPGGYVLLKDANGTYAKYDVIPPQKAQLYKGKTDTKCWFSGNDKDTRYLNFVSAPASGYTIEYPYYKSPFKPTTGSHVIEMQKPMFAVYTSLAKLHEQDGEGDRALLALQKANNAMAGMRINNDFPLWFQDHSVDDRDFVQGSGGFGV